MLKIVCFVSTVFKGTSFIRLHRWAWKQWADGDKRRDGHHHQSGELTLCKCGDSCVTLRARAALHGVASYWNSRPDLCNAASLKLKNLTAAGVTWSEGVIKWQVCVSHTRTPLALSHSYSRSKEGRTQVAKLREQTWCHYSPWGAVQRSLAVCWPAYFFRNPRSAWGRSGLTVAGKQCRFFFFFFCPSWRFSPCNLLVSQLLEPDFFFFPPGCPLPSTLETRGGVRHFEWNAPILHISVHGEFNKMSVQ